MINIPTIEEAGTTIATWLSSPYMQALLVPIVFYVVGAFSKKIIRGNNGSFFALSDWYLAPDAMLATIGGLILQTIDLMSKFDPLLHTGRTRALLVLFGITVAAYLVVMAIHSHYQQPTASPKKQFWWLVIFANGLGFSVLCLSTFAFKGIS